ncbi:MAG: SAM-dependent methyltransferase [Rhodospirillaceae bacterium]
MWGRSVDAAVASSVVERAQSDRLLFFRQWLAAPLQTAACLPSGEGLGRALVVALDELGPGLVVELGPGTGVFTSELVRRGVSPDRLVLIETNTDFVPLLRERFPDARIIVGDAFDAPNLLKENGIEGVAAFLSGLPLLVKPPSARLRLMKACLQRAVPGAYFVQFTYFYRSPVMLRQSPVVADGSSMIYKNLWPARVWRYRLSRRENAEPRVLN